MDLEYRGDADRADSLRAVGAGKARIADIEVEPALYVQDSAESAFESVRIQGSTHELRILSSVARKHGFKKGDSVVNEDGNFRIAEPPRSEEGLTVFVLEEI